MDPTIKKDAKDGAWLPLYDYHTKHGLTNNYKIKRRLKMKSKAKIEEKYASKRSC